MKRFVLLILLLAFHSAVQAELLVAVASNFLGTAQTLQQDYAQRTGEQIELSSGSTGTLYTRILRGAPYDVFMAADAWRPGLLSENHYGVNDSRMTYAIGRLALWSPNPAIADKGCLESLRAQSFRHLAIANPDTAPYGEAARETLEKIGLWDASQEYLVRAENIGHAYRFVALGSAQLGFVALSQLPEPGDGCRWVVPSDHHAPLEQQAIIVSASEKRDQAVRFLEYLASQEARELIRNSGYDLPDEL